MEPILKNPQFTSLLRLWKFITAYHDYLELPQQVGLISLYQLDEHVRNQKYQSAFIAQLIEALVRKTKGNQKTTKKQQTALFLAKNNKFKIFEHLLKTSAYELGQSQVNFSLAWKGQNLIDPEQSFENLSVKDKYQYLSLLISLISVSSQFKHEYMEKLKKQYSQANQQAGKDKMEIYQKYGIRLCPSSILGTDQAGKCYIYVSKIGDSILCFDTKKKQWSKMVGQENIKSQILEKLMKQSTQITIGELDILEGISEIWQKPGWKIQHSAFDENNKIFNISQSLPKENKLQNIKFKFHQLEQSYTKFIGDCFNFRWASKQRRLQFHQAVDEAKQMQDLVICLGQFFNQTKHTIHRKIDTHDAYDYSLDTQDLQPTEFKNIFLRKNYLYSHGVISEQENSEKFSGTLYNHIKNLLTDPSDFEPYFYEFLMIYAQSMLGIIEELYPKMYQKRLKYLETLAEEKRKKLEEEAKERQQQKKAKKSSKGRLKNKNIETKDEHSSQNSQSETTTQQKNQLPSLNGRRLRQKTQINYSSKSQLSKSRSNAKASKKQPKRQVKGKKSKMQLDSDSDQDVDLSLSESDTEKEENALNLDSYKYVEEEQTQKFRRQLRSKSKK